jgi:hypothetical protein
MIFGVLWLFLKNDVFDDKIEQASIIVMFERNDMDVFGTEKSLTTLFYSALVYVYVD